MSRGRRADGQGVRYRRIQRAQANRAAHAGTQGVDSIGSRLSPQYSRASAWESIDNRPAEVKERKVLVFGHWEMDTVYSVKNKGWAVLLTTTERKTRKEIIVLLPNRKAETITKAVNALERKFGAVKFRTIFKSIIV